MPLFFPSPDLQRGGGLSKVPRWVVALPTPPPCIFLHFGVGAGAWISGRGGCSPPSCRTPVLTTGASPLSASKGRATCAGADQGTGG